MLEIDVTGTIDRRITPNGRIGHMGRAKLVKERRTAAYWATYDAIGLDGCDLQPPLQLDFRIEWEQGRTIMDDDNAKASMKPIRDGIADALGIDDRDMESVGMEQLETETLGGRILVTVTEQRDGN